MSSVDITLHLPPPSRWHCSTQFVIPTALRNGYEKMEIPGLGVFTPVIPTTSDLNHTRELTDPHLVVRKLLGGGEIVWEEFLSHYTIGQSPMIILTLRDDKLGICLCRNSHHFR
jgi:hypothetical protein